MSFSESAQMFAVLDFNTTQMTDRPLISPVEIRQRPEAFVVPVFMPLMKLTFFNSLFVFSILQIRPSQYRKS